MRSARLPWLLLAAVLAASFCLHAYRAAHPTIRYQAADERAYGKLAVNIAERHHYGDRSTRMRDPLHWPPGAPLLFAAGHAAFGSPASERTYDIPAAHWEQAVISTGTAGLAAALVWMLAGPWAALVAAALVGTYPPLVLATGEQLSEPLGAFLLLAAFVAMAAAARARRRRAAAADAASAGAGDGVARAPATARARSPWWPEALAWALAGALLGLTALTRADLLPVPFVLAGLAFAVLARRGAWRRAVLTAGLLAGGAAVVLAPWTIYASQREGRFVPVTKGRAAALFVGTYLPGHGTTVGMKRALAPAVKRKKPRLRGRGSMDIGAPVYLGVIAARHPRLAPDEAIEREARANVARYVKHDPARFAAMMLAKVPRMWARYARGGARHTSWAVRAYHLALVLVATAGLVVALIRRRTPVLAAILVTLLLSTALHMLVVAQARYNLPLMPALIAAGVAGWRLALGRSPATEKAAATTAPAPVKPREPAPTAA